MLGAFYTGPLRFLADPYSGLSTDVTSLRLEPHALFHVRNVACCYVIDQW